VIYPAHVGHSPCGFTQLASPLSDAWLHVTLVPFPFLHFTMNSKRSFSTCAPLRSEPSRSLSQTCFPRKDQETWLPPFRLLFWVKGTSHKSLKEESADPKRDVSINERKLKKHSHSTRQRHSALKSTELVMTNDHIHYLVVDIMRFSIQDIEDRVHLAGLRSD
jgi:hypothetical protein